MPSSSNEPDEIKFCENESNVERLFAGAPTGRLYKDGLNDYVVHGQEKAVNSHKGTKGAGIYRRTIAAGASTTIRVRLSSGSQPRRHPSPTSSRSSPSASRKRMLSMPGCRAMWGTRTCAASSARPIAGILWSKQFFYYDVTQWLEGDPAQPKPPRSRLDGRNNDWPHVSMDDIVSMPDKWEFPWFAAWDWAFHLVTLA